MHACTRHKCAHACFIRNAQVCRDCTHLLLVCARLCTDLHEIFLVVAYYLMGLILKIHKGPKFCLGVIPLFFNLVEYKASTIILAIRGSNKWYFFCKFSGHPVKQKLLYSTPLTWGQTIDASFPHNFCFSG